MTPDQTCQLLHPLIAYAFGLVAGAAVAAAIARASIRAGRGEKT